MNPDPAFDEIQGKLLKAGEENVSTRQIVLNCTIRIPYDAVVDPNLQLKFFHIAAWTGDVETIREFPNGADLSAKTAGGFTALHLAASRGHSDALRELLLKVVDARPTSVEGFTALHLAAYGGHHSSVRLLLDVSDVNAKDTTFGRTALHLAAQRGHQKVVYILTGVSGVDVRSKDKVRDLTPFLLAAMQSKGHCSLDVVKRLLNLNRGQIKDKVGIRTDQVASNQVVSNFFKSPWRKLVPIKVDTSMKRIPEVDKWVTIEVNQTEVDETVNDEVDETEVDLYEEFEIEMEGHTALHLAATQNNAELVSHLASRKGVLLNEGDTKYGMTPLHCAVRTGAMETFSALMGVRKVNVNAKLVKGGDCKRPAWLPQDSAFYDVDESDLNMFKKFEQYDTPLHLAIQFCEAEILMKMVIEFCNHPEFNSAMCNSSRCTPLNVAWTRLSFCAYEPSIFKSRKIVSQQVEKYTYDVYTILRSLLLVIRSDRRSDNWRDGSEYVSQIRIQIAVPLTSSVAFAVGAFAAAGYGNLPPEAETLMLVSTIAGFLLVTFQLLRNIYVSVRLVTDATLEKSTTGTRSDEEKKLKRKWLAFFLGPIVVPLIFCKERGIGFRGKVKFSPCYGESGKIFTYRMGSDLTHLGFLGIQFYGVVAVFSTALWYWSH